MFSIQKSFLASARSKYLALQLLKTNYGFASSSQDSQLSSNDSEQTKRIEVLLPEDSSVVAMLMRVAAGDGEDPENVIDDIKSAPPGIRSVFLTLEPGVEYYVYILSNDFKDGFVSTTNTLIPYNDRESTRQTYTIESPVSQITPIIERSTEETPETWYNYQGSYTGPLVWSADILGAGESSNAYLVYLKDIVGDILTLFEEEFAGIRANVEELESIPLQFSTMNEALRALAVRDKLTLLYREYNRDENLKRFSPIVDVLQYLGQPNVIDEKYLLRLTASVPGPTDANTVLGKGAASWFSQAHVAQRYGDIANVRFDEIGEDRSADRYYYDDVRRLTRNTEFTRTYPPMYEGGNYVYGLLRGVTFPDALSDEDVNEQQGGFIKTLVTDHINRANGVIFQDYGIRVDYRDVPAQHIESFETSTKNLARLWYNNFFAYITDLRDEVDEKIRAVGDLVFSDGIEGLPKLAHEAVLQNIRYIKNLVSDVENDIWTHITSTNAMLTYDIKEIQKTVKSAFSSNNTIVNISSSYVEANDVEVLICDDLARNNWTPFSGRVANSNDSVLFVDLSSLTKVGKYTLLVRPKKIEIAITNTLGQNVVSTPDLNDYTAKNYFYGWNIEFEQAGRSGRRIGELRVITGSRYVVNDHRLLISPSVDGKIDFSANVIAKIWPNSFVPMLVEIDITEHDIQTLSFAEYGKREFNRDTGLVTLYDYAGNVYKQWTIGERTLASDNFQTIEFRLPV